MRPKKVKILLILFIMFIVDFDGLIINCLSYIFLILAWGGYVIRKR